MSEKYEIHNYFNWFYGFRWTFIKFNFRLIGLIHDKIWYVCINKLSVWKCPGSQAKQNNSQSLHTWCTELPLDYIIKHNAQNNCTIYEQMYLAIFNLVTFTFAICFMFIKQVKPATQHSKSVNPPWTKFSIKLWEVWNTMATLHF